MEFTLLSAALIAVMAVYGMLYWEARRGNAASCTRSLWDVALTAIIAGIFVGRVAAMIEGGVNPLSNPGDLLIVRGGVATGPAAIAALATVAWLARRELWPVADGLAAATLAGLSGWHAGCVVRNACLGTASDLPWAFAQGGSSLTRHPVELYAAAAFTLAAGLAVWMRTRWPIAGVVVGFALAVAGITRLATEPLRPSLGSGPVIWYAAAAIAGIAVVFWRLSHARALRQPPSPTAKTDTN